MFNFMYPQLHYHHHHYYYHYSKYPSNILKSFLTHHNDFMCLMCGKHRVIFSMYNVILMPASRGVLNGIEFSRYIFQNVRFNLSNRFKEPLDSSIRISILAYTESCTICNLHFKRNDNL